MKTLIVGNQKGGVGKTTLALHLAHYAASQLGQRVLALDLDEGDLREGMAPQSEIGPGTLVASTLFTDEPLHGQPLVVAPRLDLIPSDVALLDVDDMPMQVVANLKGQLDRLSDRYDLCIVDTPPNLQRRMIAALVAGDALVSPMGLDAFSIARVPKLLTTVATIRSEFNPELRMLGFLPNRFNTKSRTEVASLPGIVEGFGGQIIGAPLTERAAIKNAATAGVPIWLYQRSGNTLVARAEMTAACKAVFDKLND